MLEKIFMKNSFDIKKNIFDREAEVRDGKERLWDCQLEAGEAVN